MRGFLKRHLLLAGLMGVLIPLGLLLFLQYRWLSELEKKSAIAHEATLKNLLEGIATETEYFYRANAERVLNLPPSVFTQNQLGKAAYYFEKKGVRGVRRLFVVSFYREDWGKLLFFEPSMTMMEPPSSLTESRAAYVASAPWMVMSQKGSVLDKVALSVDERDPDNRVILNPILDESSRLVGVSGMILDQEFFSEVLLPGIIDKAVPEFFPAEVQKLITVHIHGGGDDKTDGKAHAKDEARKALTFVFTDYHLGLTTHFMNPKEWARASFILNMTLAGVLAVVLLGGVVISLRTASRQMKLSQMKSDFVSNVSHELRTPLASIRVFGEFLRLGRVTDPDKLREYGEFIETESRRLTGLVNNILDFSKIDSGAKTYNLEEADLNGIVAETLRTFEVRMRHSGFRIEVERADPLPPMRVDPDAVGQAVGNLLDNAVKYSGDAREIAVKIERQNGWAVISVEDHGVGISRAEQAKIFERFHRVGNSLVHDVKGSGLGLAIVRHIVEAHKGLVSVESQPGKGSVFTIKLPLTEGGVHA